MASQQPVAGIEPRIAAATALAGVLGGNRFSPLIERDLADPRDRALANRLVTGALRRHGHLNIVLGELLKKGTPNRSGLFEAHLRIALAQLLFLPDLGAHSALFLAVEAIRRDNRARPFDRLANGVLREAQRRAAQYQSLPPERLFPNWLTTRWRAAYGEAGLAAFAEALLIGAPLDLTLREIDPGLVAELGATPVLADSVRLGERDRPVTELPGFAEGQWWVQDAAAALPARLLNLPEGARVLDLCAAPGGKTAQLIKAGFRVTALDNDAARLARLGENLARLGYSADLVQADAIDHTSNEPFDGVLLDAPCSATGTFRRHPEVVWLRNEADLAGRSALQQKISANAARLLKPGGVLVFCTCSLEPEEGENIAAWIATSLPELEPSALVETDLSGFSAALTADGCLRTHPAMIVPGEAGGTLDGFFAARFTKRFSPSS